MTARRDRSGADDIKALAAAARLFDDQRFQEIGYDTDKAIRHAVHDGLLRFKKAGYSLSDAICALSFALGMTLATVQRDTRTTPEDLGRTVAEALRRARKRKDMKDII